MMIRFTIGLYVSVIQINQLRPTFALPRRQGTMRVMEQENARYRSGRRESGWIRNNGKRLLWAVVAGSLFHAAACIVARPFEFGNGDRLHTFLKALFSGLLSFPIVFAALLWPLQALMQWQLPNASRW